MGVESMGLSIGFISGDIVEIDNKRGSVSVPDYPVQGFLIKKLLERGHDVVLLTRHPASDDVPEGLVVDAGGDPMDHDLDILFGDRLGTIGVEWETTLRQIEQYEGHIIYHQYVPYSGWAPPFKEMTWLAAHNRDWLIINRSPDPRRTYNQMVGIREKVTNYGVIKFATWRPFFMLEYPWGWKMDDLSTLGERPYRQGYYGRVPRSEMRAKKVASYLNHNDWTRVAYGPESSTKHLAEATGCANGGRILHRDLPASLATMDTIVQVSIDRLRNHGHLNYWPHRVVECALAGVVQFFDVEMDLPDFKEWEVRNATEYRHRVAALDKRSMIDTVEAQRDIILPYADPKECMDELEDIMQEQLVAVR